MLKKLPIYTLCLLVLLTNSLANADSNNSLGQQSMPGMTPEMHPIKTGFWTFFYYPNPLQNQEIKAGYCLSPGNTWITAGPIRVDARWSGAWLQDTNQFQFYGVQADTPAGYVISLTGQVIGSQLIVGRYVKFSSQQNMPNGHYGAFKAVYNGLGCPR